MISYDHLEKIRPTNFDFMLYLRLMDKERRLPDSPMKIDWCGLVNCPYFNEGHQRQDCGIVVRLRALPNGKLRQEEAVRLYGLVSDDPQKLIEICCGQLYGYGR